MCSLSFLVGPDVDDAEEKKLRSHVIQIQNALSSTLIDKRALSETQEDSEQSQLDLAALRQLRAALPKFT